MLLPLQQWHFISLVKNKVVNDRRDTYAGYSDNYFISGNSGRLYYFTVFVGHA